MKYPLACAAILVYFALFTGCATSRSGSPDDTATRSSTAGSSAPSTHGSLRPVPKAEVLQFTDVDEGAPHIVPIYRLGAGAYGFVAGLEIDVDGSPNAYHPDDIGLDYLANAGMPVLPGGRKLSLSDPDWQQTWKTYFNLAREQGFRGPTKFVWHGLVTDEEGVPVVQGENDPAPGYYVSQTSLVDRSVRDATSPRRYVDSSKVPYIALPRAVRQVTSTSMGDLAVVFRPDTDTLAFAIVADAGQSTQLGEGSIKLAQDLGHDPLRGEPHPRAIAGYPGPLYYLLIPSSGTGDVMSTETIAERGKALLDAWGGLDDLKQALSEN